MTDVIRIPGDPIQPLRFLTAVPDGHLFWHTLFGSAERARVNRAREDPANGKAEIVGGPNIQPGYMDLNGLEGAEAVVKTQVLGTPIMTILSLVWIPTTVEPNTWPVFFSSALGGNSLGPNGTGLMLSINNTSGNRSLAVQLANGTAYTGTACSLPTPTNAGSWALMLSEVRATSARLYDLIHGVASATMNFAADHHHLPSIAPFRFGDHANDAGADNSLFDGPSRHNQHSAWNRLLSRVESSPGAKDSELHKACFEMLDAANDPNGPNLGLPREIIIAA